MTKPNSGRVLLELTKHLWRGGQYAYWWSMSQDEQTKQTQWFPANAPTPPSKDWGERHQYFGVHPTNAKGSGKHRATNATVAAINCLFADFDAKDEVLPDEYEPCLPGDYGDLKPTEQKSARKAAQETAMMLDLSTLQGKGIGKSATMSTMPYLACGQRRRLSMLLAATGYGADRRWQPRARQVAAK